MGEVVKLWGGYSKAKTLLKGLKVAGLSLLGLGGAAIVAALTDEATVSIILGQAKVAPAVAAVLIPAIVAAASNWKKNKDK